MWVWECVGEGNGDEAIFGMGKVKRHLILSRNRWTIDDTRINFSNLIETSKFGQLLEI